MTITRRDFDIMEVKAKLFVEETWQEHQRKMNEVDNGNQTTGPEVSDQVDDAPDGS